MSTKLSILVPVYGVERYIETCATSLFEQTYPDIEYVFVDDCSPDGSIELLRRIIMRYPSRHGSVSIIRHDTNSGLGAARATALSHATGDYVMHVDSDDCLPLDACSHLMDKALETEADIVDGGYAETCHGKVSQTFLPFHGSKEVYLRQMLCQNIVSNRIWGRIYRRTLFTRHGIKPVKGVDYSEDFCVVPRLLFHAQRAYTDQVVYHYRTDNLSSYTHQVSAKNLCSMQKASLIVYDYFMKNDTSRQYAFALQLGMLNLLRTERKHRETLNGVSSRPNTMDVFRPQGLTTKILAACWQSHCPYAVANAVYLAVRKIYVTYISAPWHKH